MKNYIFSAINNMFYPLALREVYDAAGTWPTDGLEVDDALFTKLSGVAPEGKIRVVSEGGLPCWVDIPPLSVDELITAAAAEKQRLITVANTVVEPLADAVELEMATAEERQRYDEWRKYRVSLTRVDITAIPINWPLPPAA
ncbi:Caudovirales tail fibre assembly protein [Leminorella richardii]|uniref:Caudovirales tail fibre assembly protein n=2 Tax=Leminorella richardii TaxID=158841 RepID=A0A2X4V2H3_9GAMM|nr:Caudovirales tail fibre assembly protein [Leminorella richardii]